MSFWATSVSLRRSDSACLRSASVSSRRASGSSEVRSRRRSSIQYSSSSVSPRASSSRSQVDAPLEPLLQLQQPLLLVLAVLLDRGVDLVLQAVEVSRAGLLVDRGDDRAREVEDLLQLLGGDVQHVADAARDALEEPDVADGSGQVDVAHALAAHLRARHLDAAALADDALVADALVLAAVALPVLGRTEDLLAEEPVLLRLQRPVVDGLGLGHLARAPLPDLLRGGQPDRDGVEVVDVDQSRAFLVCRGRAHCARRGVTPPVRRGGPGPGPPRGAGAPVPPAPSSPPSRRRRTARPTRPRPRPRPPPRPRRAPARRRRRPPGRPRGRRTGRSRAPRPPAGGRRPPRAP